MQINNKTFKSIHNKQTLIVYPRKIIARSNVGGSITRIEHMINSIHRDIDKLFDEMLPLDTNIDIDMVCYTQEYGNYLECYPAMLAK